MRAVAYHVDNRAAEAEHRLRVTARYGPREVYRRVIVNRCVTSCVIASVSGSRATRTAKIQHVLCRVMLTTATTATAGVLITPYTNV